MKKKIIWIVTIVFLLAMIAGGILIWMRYTHLQDIRSHYGELVTTSHADIYCMNEKKYEKCGTISTNVTIPLKKQKVESISNAYFQMKGTDYYVLYQEVESTKEKPEQAPDYIEFNQSIHTLEITNLYQQNELAITLNQEMTFTIFYQDSENYYVKYLEQVFAIPKSENIEVYEETHTEEETATQIPVLYFDDMNTWKDTNNWVEQKQKMVEYGYHTITVSEYEKWLNGYIRIPDHAILLLSNESSQVDDFMVEAKVDTIAWKESSTVSTTGNANIYHVKNTTTQAQFEKMLNGEPVILSSPIQKVAVLNYHFFYNPEGGEVCNEGICLSTQKFEEQLQYLKNNGYHTLTMTEFRDWMYGKIEIPEKSVLLTVDDGAMGTGKHNGNKLIPLLEKYDLHATLFLITGWWSIENYRSPNLDIESHTYDMHTGNLCSNQTRGAQLLCSTYEQVIEDLKKSIAVTQSTKAFCFPFYAYNDTAIRQVQEVGFELAFVGGNYKASRQSDKYKIPRYPIYADITLNQFIGMIS